MNKKLTRKMILAGIALGATALIWAGSPVTSFAGEGAALYKKQCKKCHGKKGEGKKNKKKPGKFRYEPVNNISKDDLVKSLNDYLKMWNDKSWKNKSEKKMAKATRKLNEGQIVTLSDFIVTLKK